MAFQSLRRSHQSTAEDSVRLLATLERSDMKSTSDAKGKEALRHSGADAESVSWAQESTDELSREKLQMIKAKTMYEMVEEIELRAGPCRLLFLSNMQAELIASSNDSLQKMLDVLEIPKPQLVINLLASYGFGEQVKIVAEGGYGDVGDIQSTWAAGLVRDGAAFESAEAERAAEDRIDQFMADVIIPLAAQTNAIIITNAIITEAILTRCLSRMHAVTRAKWGGKPPFTILSTSTLVGCYYHNPDLNANWREVRLASRTWRGRDNRILNLVQQLDGNEDGNVPVGTFDIDPNAEVLLMADSIESKKESSWDGGPMNRLITRLVRYLGSTLPSLTIKTGWGDTLKLTQTGASQSGVDIALNVAQGGAPVLFLDVRERPLIEAANRAALIEAAKQQYIERADALLKLGRADALYSCTIAHLHDICYGDRKDHAAKMQRRASTARLDLAASGATASVKRRTPLHEAVRQASDTNYLMRKGRESDAAQGMGRATADQVNEVAGWFADRYFRDAFEVNELKQKLEAEGETYQSLYKEQIHALTTWTRALIASPNFHDINLSDRDGAKLLVGRLVRLDRLPKYNALEGLLLLQEAWKAHDVAVHLADLYKVQSKVLFVVQLVVVWMVTMSTMKSDELGYQAANCHGGAAMAGGAAVAAERHDDGGGRAGLGILQTLRTWAGSAAFEEAAFILAAVASVLVSIDSILNAKLRWRQLRSGAGSLESMIWCYRTRVGAFEVHSAEPSHSRAPEMALRNALIAWRRNLIAGGDLQVSGLSKEYDASIYTHHQFADSGPLPEDATDDYYSPVKPHKYIDLRLLPTIAFYERRTPAYVAHRYTIKFLLLLCTLVATVLARYHVFSAVVGVTSAAAALTSWQEYADVARKTERYTRAAFELENLLSWWKSLSEVEKASKAVIAELIHTGEGIISEERLAWMSTPSQRDAATTGGGDARRDGRTPDNGTKKAEDDAYSA